MTWAERMNLFSPLDHAALALLVGLWLWIGWRIERHGATRISVSVLMEGFRREWMRVMLAREPRILDSQMLAILRQGTAFFASASMIAIGGGLALIGNTERLAGVAADLTSQDVPAIVWEIKIIVVLLFVANSFLKYVWAHRLFGYCAVLMAAVPNEAGAPGAGVRAEQTAALSNTAARSFNKGMRSTYFALAGVAWLLGPVALGAAALATAAILWRREFASQSRAILLKSPPETGR
ncbi:MAG: DUF599 domain-containing protein [Pseudooceanicola sp.]|nr:DUF599 domain-containing protein [Pseudooceanicola sp.]